MNMTFEAPLCKPWTLTDDSIIYGKKVIKLSEINRVQYLGMPTSQNNVGVIRIFLGPSNRYTPLMYSYDHREDGDKAAKYILNNVKAEEFNGVQKPKEKKKSVFPIMAGILFILATLFQLAFIPYLHKEFPPSVSIISIICAVAELATGIMLLARYRGRMLPVALYVFGLSTILLNITIWGVSLIVYGPMEFMKADNWMGLSLLVLATMALLATGKKAAIVKYLWALPPAFMLITLLVAYFNRPEQLFGSYMKFFGEFSLVFWGSLLLSVWLTNTEITFSDVFQNISQENFNHLDDGGSISKAVFLRGVLIFGLPISLVSALALIFLSGTHMFTDESHLLPAIFVIMPIFGGLVNFFIAMNTARKITNNMNRSVNEIKARSGVPGVAEQAQAALKADAAKEAQKVVAKSAIAGGLIGGDVGAVVGAVSAKAGLDAMNQEENK